MFRLLLIRMFNTTFVGVDGLPRFGHARGLTLAPLRYLGDPQYTNFGSELVFSADFVI